MKDRTPVDVPLTHERLVASQAALRRLGSIPLPPKSAYWIAKTLKKVDAKVSSVAKQLHKQRFELIKSLGVEEMAGDPPAPTGNWNVRPENEENFQEQWRVILDLPVMVESIKLIPLSLLGDNPLTSAEAAALDWLLELDDEEA